MKVTPAVPVAILVRVSTAKQETARQVSELQAVAEAKGWQVVAVCEEQAVSGRADQDQRHGLNEVERLARAEKIKKVLVHEVSRLGRRNSIVHSFVEMLEEVGVAEARRNGVKLGRPEGSGLDGAALLAKHKDVVKALKAGQSIRNAAKITGKGGSTVQRVAAALKG